VNATAFLGGFRVDERVNASNVTVLQAQASDRFGDAGDVRTIYRQIHVFGQTSGKRITGCDMEENGQSTHNAVFDSGLAKSPADPLSHRG
jgi:hypothetical protein